MIWAIAKLILIFIVLAVAVIIISTVVWLIAAMVKWFRKERRRKHG